MFQPTRKAGLAVQSLSKRGDIVSPGGVDNGSPSTRWVFAIASRPVEAGQEAHPGPGRFLREQHLREGGGSVHAGDGDPAARRRGVELRRQRYGQLQESLLLQSSFDSRAPRPGRGDDVPAQRLPRQRRSTWVYARPVVSVEMPGARLVIDPASGGGTGAARPPAWKVYARSAPLGVDRQVAGQAAARDPRQRAGARAGAVPQGLARAHGPDGCRHDRTARPSCNSSPPPAACRSVSVLAPSQVQVYDHLWRAAIGEDPRPASTGPCQTSG